MVQVRDLSSIYCSNQYISANGWKGKCTFWAGQWWCLCYSWQPCADSWL